jgi:hypothetical protein
VTKPRKGEAYVPELAILLRDAQPIARELGDPVAMRRCELARDELFRVYRDAERAGAVAALDPGARMFCEDVKRANGGKLPPRKGGRPKDEHRRLGICQKVQQRINDGGGVVESLKAVSEGEKPPLPCETVRDIWYDPDPAWQRLKLLALAELAMRTGAG